MDRPKILRADDLDGLLGALRDAGWTPIGPVARDGAIVYDEVGSVGDLPSGWSDRQEPGGYRLERRDDGAFFGWAVGPHTWKRFLFPPSSVVWSAGRTAEGRWTFEEGDPDPPAWALIGARACDIAAIAIQDRVLTGGEFVDPAYRRRRESVFVVAVQCGHPAATCFCASMGTGPAVTGGFDLSLTELLDDAGHRFVVEVGSDAGGAILEAVPHEDASEADVALAERIVEDAAGRMGRAIDTDGLPESLADRLEHPRWDDVAERCLACGNCTLVCPTCFCSKIEDAGDLTGDGAVRTRRWDSCFAADHSAMHGGVVRASRRARYRQWLTHKLSTWHAQFGTSGCVGCGRCIAWCPVGIDITEEVAALRADGGGRRADGTPAGRAPRAEPTTTEEARP